MVLRKCLISWCQMSTWRRPWTLSLTELMPHGDLAGTRSERERAAERSSSREHVSPGLVARGTRTLTGFLVQRRKTVKELTEHVAWGPETRDGGGLQGPVGWAGAPWSFSRPTEPPGRPPLSAGLLPPIPLSILFQIVANLDRIKTLPQTHILASHC